MNRRKAIRKKCLDCSGNSSQEVANCKYTQCQLYPFRKINMKQNAQERKKSIHEYCRDFCMNESVGEVSKCVSVNCPLHCFRNSHANLAKRAYRDTSADENDSDMPEVG